MQAKSWQKTLCSRFLFINPLFSGGIPVRLDFMLSIQYPGLRPSILHMRDYKMMMCLLVSSL